METELAGQAIIVTGGNGNIGRGIVPAFAAEGANVVIAARDETAGRAVERAAREAGAQGALWLTTDVLDRVAIARLVAATIETFGAVDVLVNNVGGHVNVAPFWETTPEQVQSELDLNLRATLDCTRAVLPSMIERGYGRVINVGSTSGIVGDPYMAPYSAAKGSCFSSIRTSSSASAATATSSGRCSKRRSVSRVRSSGTSASRRRTSRSTAWRSLRGAS